MGVGGKNLVVFATQMTASGGIENHLVRLCERLAAEGARVEFFCPDYRAGAGLDTRLRAACSRMALFGGGASKQPGWKRFAWLVSKAVAWPSLPGAALYLNGQGGAPHWVAKLMRRKVSKTVLHHHSAGDGADAATWPSSYRRLLASADAVIACSTTNAAAISRKIGRPAEVVYCYSEPCGVLPKGPGGGKLEFGFFGRLIPEKGIDTILRLSQEPSLSDIRWNLWGPAEGYPPDFAAGFPNVVFHGVFHDRAGLLAAMGRLDAFALFSTHNEGLPLTLLEAMGAGIPWIASDRGGIRDLVVDSSSTILLRDGFGYTEALAASRRLADSIKSGATAPAELRRAYDQKFHPDKLTRDWLRMFGFLK
jgi:glycosyltransferase involved in cell wall biosynthesis